MAPGEVHFDYYKRIIPLSFIFGSTVSLFIGLFFYNWINPYLFFLFYCINYGLGAIIDPDEDQPGLTLAEGRVLRGTKGINPIFGFVGAFHVAYWFIYAYIIGLAGGHRSWLSHQWIIGTIFRMIYFNIPFFVGLWMFYSYTISAWGWVYNGFEDIAYAFYANWWFAPYLLSQFLAWFVSDGMHLILDTEWAKYKLYVPVISKRN